MFGHLYKAKNKDKTKKRKILRTHLYTVPSNFDYGQLNRTTAIKAYQEFEKYQIGEWWRLFVDGVKYLDGLPKKFFPFNLNVLDASLASQYNISDRVLKEVISGQEHGWVEYENREHGVLANCLHAFQYALSHLRSVKNFDTATINEIHFRLTHTLSQHYKPGKWKSSELISVGISKMRVNPAGLTDLFSKIKSGELAYAYLTMFPYVISNAASDELKPVLPDIMDLLTRQNPDKYKFDQNILTIISACFPSYYELLIRDLSAYLSTHDTGARFYSVGSNLTEIVAMNTNLWSRLDIDNKYREMIDFLAPKYMPICDEETIDYLVTNLPNEILAACNEYITKFIFEGDLSAKLNDKIIDDFYQYIKYENANEESFVEFNLKELKIDSLEAYKNIKNPIEFKAAFTKRLYCFGIRQLLFNLGSKRVELYMLSKHTNILDKYYQKSESMETASNKEILSHIGQCIQEFQRLHIYQDGAGRTYVNILLNMFLLSYGFPPATFIQPNVFDAFDDLASVIARGILNTLEIYDSYDQKQEVDLFGVKTSDINKSLDKQITGVTMDDIVRKAIDFIIVDAAINDDHMHPDIKKHSESSNSKLPGMKL